ncbi:MAG: peptidase [Microcystaceae cyanobacterium]
MKKLVKLLYRNFLLVTITTCLLMINLSGILAENPPLPPLQVYPLPKLLQEWHDLSESGDYFDQVTSSSLGYLLWTEFPVKVYVEQPVTVDEAIASEKRFQQWTNAVLQTIEEWKVYFPLTFVNSPEAANIEVLRVSPPLGSRIDPETGQLIIPRARTAQTTYEFKVEDRKLTHHMTVRISPKLSESSVFSASRHEFGHALGIWGHSPIQTDALYFSQVRNPPPISTRDINTLKKVYQQPTRLGGKVNNSD